MKLGDINVNILQCLQQVITEQGKNAESLFSDFGLGGLGLSHPDRRISIPRYMRLGEQAARLTNRQDIGILMGEKCRSHHFGLMGLTAQSAATLGDALETSIRFERLYSSNSRGHSFVRREAERTGFCFYSISPYNRYNYFVVDAVLGGWLSLLQEWSGSSLPEISQAGATIEIEFERPTYAAAYRKWKLPVQFSAQGNTLWLPNELCQSNTVHGNLITFRQLERLCQQALGEILQGRTLVDKVGEAIAMQLSGQTPSLSSVARHFSLEPWTLRRQLQSEGVSFTQLLDQTRKELATRYIRDTKLTIGEIAWLMGFSSSPAFQRAFKRWHGQAPGQYRSQQQ